MSINAINSVNEDTEIQKEIPYTPAKESIEVYSHAQSNSQELIPRE